jgi:hypothetical protein
VGRLVGIPSGLRQRHAGAIPNIRSYPEFHSDGGSNDRRCDGYSGAYHPAAADRSANQHDCYNGNSRANQRGIRHGAEQPHRCA